MEAHLPPRSPALAQARAWADQKRWDRVLALTPELLAQNPELLEAHKLATRASINCGEHREANKMAKTCVQMGPNNADAHYLAAVAASNVGLLSIAHQHIKTALNLEPNWATLHQFQARLYLRRKHTEKALAALREARRLAPENAEIYGELIQLESTGKFSPTEVCAITKRYEDALALAPENPTLNFKFGRHLLNLAGDYTRARQCLGTALRMQPDDSAVRRAYFLALRHTDPVYRGLYAPYRWAEFLNNRLHKTWTAWWQLLLTAIFIVPIFLLMVTLLFIHLFIFLLPTKLYELLTVTDIRAQAMGREVGEISWWSWRRLKLWQRGLLFGFIICVPWLLLGLFIWAPTVFVALLGVVVVLSWADFMWYLWRWFRQGWVERKTALSNTIIIRGLILLFLFGLFIAGYRDKVTPEFFDILLFYFTLAALYTSYKVRFKDKGEL